MKAKGFSLIELVIVLLFISILAMMASPNITNRLVSEQVQESLDTVEELKTYIRVYYIASGEFPEDNASAGLPPPSRLLGNYISRVDVEDGAFHITFGNKAHQTIQGKIVTVRPAYVPDSPASPISWICGVSRPAEGMEAAGEDKTDLPAMQLPLSCRY